MSFRPHINDSLSIDNVAYYVAEHPSAPGMPYGQEGRQAVVYRLLAADGSSRALKVFKARFRIPALVRLSERLAAFADLPGLQVCRRTVLTARREPDLLARHPDLTYAVLMPWIDGSTWMDVLLDQRALPPDQSLLLARGLADLLASLEEQGLAHCDLSAPNVLLPALVPRAGASAPVELVDVEQMYGPGLDRPDALPGGSAGYAHKTAPTGLWSAQADRFAGAVLLAEMLGWSDPAVCAAAYGETYFEPDELQHPGQRFTALSQSLHIRWGEPVARLFERAWHSDLLDDCPTFGEWLALIPRSVPERPFVLPVAGKRPQAAELPATPAISARSPALDLASGPTLEHQEVPLESSVAGFAAEASAAPPTTLSFPPEADAPPRYVAPFPPEVDAAPRRSRWMLAVAVVLVLILALGGWVLQSQASTNTRLLAGAATQEAERVFGAEQATRAAQQTLAAAASTSTAAAFAQASSTVEAQRAAQTTQAQQRQDRTATAQAQVWAEATQQAQVTAEAAQTVQAQETEAAQKELASRTEAAAATTSAENRSATDVSRSTATARVSQRATAASQTQLALQAAATQATEAALQATNQAADQATAQAVQQARAQQEAQETAAAQNFLESLSGEWSGTTSQGRQVLLRVQSGVIAKFSVNISTGGDCGDGGTTLWIEGMDPRLNLNIVNRRFSFSYLMEGGSVSFSGVFNSDRSVSGTYEYSSSRPPCNGSLNLSWNATKN